MYPSTIGIPAVLLSAILCLDSEFCIDQRPNSSLQTVGISKTIHYKVASLVIKSILHVADHEYNRTNESRPNISIHV